MKYTQAQLDAIATYWNCFVCQDEDGNVAGNSDPDAESGWRPIYADRCAQAIAQAFIDHQTAEA